VEARPRDRAPKPFPSRLTCASLKLRTAVRLLDITPNDSHIAFARPAARRVGPFVGFQIEVTMSRGIVSNLSESRRSFQFHNRRNEALICRRR